MPTDDYDAAETSRWPRERQDLLARMLALSRAVFTGQATDTTGDFLLHKYPYPKQRVFPKKRLPSRLARVDAEAFEFLNGDEQRGQEERGHDDDRGREEDESTPFGRGRSSNVEVVIEVPAKMHRPHEEQQFAEAALEPERERYQQQEEQQLQHVAMQHEPLQQQKHEAVQQQQQREHHTSLISHDTHRHRDYKKPTTVENILVSLGNCTLTVGNGVHVFPETTLYRYIPMKGGADMDALMTEAKQETGIPDIPDSGGPSTSTVPSPTGKTMLPTSRHNHGLLIRFRENQRELMYMPRLLSISVGSADNGSEMMIQARAQVPATRHRTAGPTFTLAITGPMRAHLFAMFQSIQSEIERVATLGQPGIGGKSLPRAESLTFGEVAEDVEAERMQEKLEGYHGGRVNVVALKRQLDENDRKSAIRLSKLAKLTSKAPLEDGAEDVKPQPPSRRTSQTTGSTSTRDNNLPPTIPYQPHYSCAYCETTISTSWHRGPREDVVLCGGCARAWICGEITID